MLTAPGTPPLAAAGRAHGADAPREAVAEAVAQAGPRPSLVLLFTDGLDPTAAIGGALAAAGSAPVAGMTASGVITAAGPLDGGASALAFGRDVVAAVGMAEAASSDPRAAGRQATRNALREAQLRPGHGLLALFIDTSSGDQSEVIAGAYEVAGPDVPLTGGAAGGSQPAQLAHGSAGRDRVVAVAIGSPRPVGVGIAHGCSPGAVPGIVTRAEGRRLMKIDGRPAETVYLEKLGVEPADIRDDDAFRALATVHPLAQPELRGDVRLRHVLGRYGDGALECATAIPPNAAIEFSAQTEEAIIQSTFHAVSDALRPLGTSPARAALVFDCAGRRSALGGAGRALEAEVGALTSSFGPSPPPLAGLYTRGEVGRVRGAKGDRNHAVVVAAFG